MSLVLDSKRYIKADLQSEHTPPGFGQTVLVLFCTPVPALGDSDSWQMTMDFSSKLSRDFISHSVSTSNRAQHIPNSIHTSSACLQPPNTQEMRWGILRSLTQHSCRGRLRSLALVADDSSVIWTQTKKSLPQSSSCRTGGRKQLSTISWITGIKIFLAIALGYVTLKSWIEFKVFLYQERSHIRRLYSWKLKSSLKQEMHLLALLQNSARAKINISVTF